MIFIQTNKNNQVVSINYTAKEGIQEGYYVDGVPEPTQKEGHIAILNYTEARGFWTSYEEIPESNEVKLQERIDELEEAVLELTAKIGSGN